jgi:hypothetical protein
MNFLCRFYTKSLRKWGLKSHPSVVFSMFYSLVTEVLGTNFMGHGCVLFDLLYRFTFYVYFFQHFIA